MEGKFSINLNRLVFEMRFKVNRDTSSGFRDFVKGDNFCDSLLAPIQLPSEKLSTLKGKNSLPRGARVFLLEQVFYLLEQIPFQKGAKTILIELSTLKVHQFPLTFAMLNK